jgi:hypothetical protein
MKQPVLCVCCGLYKTTRADERCTKCSMGSNPECPNCGKRDKA